MDTEDIQSLVEDLGSNIDDLEESLAPLLRTALSASTSKLPLLDKAKLYVLATYAIESILFSALRLNGTDAKSHPIFQELARVKEYFGKIKSAETAGQKRSTTVDKEAAGRFIKAGLAGNDRYDQARADRQAKEKNGAKRKLEEMSVGTHTRFDGAAKRIRADEEGHWAVEDGDNASVAAKDTEDEVIIPDRTAPGHQAAKRQRKAERRAAREAENNDNATGDVEDSTSVTKRTKSSKAPKSHSETFQALLQGPLPKTEDKKKGRRKKKRSLQALEDQRAEEMQ